MTTINSASEELARDPNARPVPFMPVAATPTGNIPVTTSVTPRLEPALEQRHRWERRYRLYLQLSDAEVVLGVAALAAVLDVFVAHQARAMIWGDLLVPAVTSVVWLMMLSLFHTRSIATIGSGTLEYKRVANATGLALGLVAMLFVMFQLTDVRMQLLVALPLGLAGLLVERRAWRKWLVARRIAGLYNARTVITGTRDDVGYVIRTLQSNATRPYTVIGVATSDADHSDIVVDGAGYPFVGEPGSVAQAARRLGADSVIVAGRPENEPDYIKDLSWALEGTAAELILCSRLVDIAGPRMSFRQIDGLPLVHVRIPEFDGGAYVLKRTLDIVVSLLALIPIALIGIVIAMLIKVEDHGPVFFRQTRVGRDGTEFKMVKFRSMRIDAEAELAGLKALNEGSGPLFKLKRDPRITRVGSLLRKYSLDELPQFWNVLRGDMSVVGPRPPLPSEVSTYDGRVYRRLYIKPGITGLWQVSGRSDLSWNESVRLDLHYVENWSVMTDIVIMWRTARMLIAPKGAY